MNKLIDNQDPRYRLGMASMDETHQEFMTLVNRLGSADKATFIQLFPQLLEHTEIHFSSENDLMESSGFPAIREHSGEHLRVLGDLHRMGQRVAAGSVATARAYVEQALPDWFQLHAATMDSALAAHLKNRMVQMENDLVKNG
jgi:hemerythrin-like metal-binding protein